MDTTASPEIVFAPPFTYDVLSSALPNTEVGTISTSQSPTIGILFLIVNILTQKFPQATSSQSSLNATLDECSLDVLLTLKEPRSHFCINHNNGKIFTTQNFLDSKATGDTTYNLTVRAVNSKNVILQERQYSIIVKNYPQCNIINQLIGKLSANKQCTTGRVEVRKLTSTKSIRNITQKFPIEKDFEDFRMQYLIGFDLELTPNIPIESETGKTDITVTITVDGVTEEVKFEHILNKPKTYTKYLTKPLVLLYEVRQDSSKVVSIQTSYGVSGGRSAPLSIIPSSYGLYFLEDFDYCSQREPCFADASLLRSTFLTLPLYDYTCDIKDFNMYQYKYGSCSESSSPTISSKQYNVNVPITSQDKIVLNDFTQDNNFIRYRLQDIKGPVAGDFGSTSSQECDGIPKFQPPQSYFCLNSQAGDIYPKFSLLNNNKLDGNTYNLTIQANDIRFPFRTTTKTISILMKDQCAPARGFFSEFITSRLGCRSNHGFAIPDKSYKYQPGDDVARIIGLNINAKNVPDGTVQAISINVETTDQKIVKHEFQINLKNKRGQYYSFLINLYLDTTLKTTIQVLLTDDMKVNLLANDFEFVYLRNWGHCDKESCLDLYKQWNTSYTAVLQANSICNNKDDKTLNYMYEQCFDLRPSFVGSPLRSGATPLQIAGCKYSSLVDLNKYSYFLINGKTKININSINWALDPDAGKPQRRKRRDINDPMVSTYTSSSTYPTYDQQGDVQCGIFDPKRMKKEVLSAKTNIVFSPPVSLGTPQPAVVNVEAGKRFIITCVFKSELALLANHTYWLKDGKTKIANTIDAKVDDSAGGQVFIVKLQDLIVPTASLADSGSYQCAVFVPGGMDSPILSKASKVNVQELLLNFTSSPSWEQDKIAGSVTVKGCAIEFNNPRQSTNMDNYAYFLVNGRIRVNLTSDLIRQEVGYRFPDFPITSYKQAGSFQCVIYDPARMKLHLVSASTTAFILNETFVSLQPKIIRNPLQPGDTLEISECMITTPVNLDNFGYFFNGTLGNYPKVGIGSTRRGISTITKLIIAPTNLSSAGEYKCGVLPRGSKDWIYSESVKVAQLKAFTAVMKSNPASFSDGEGRLRLKGCQYESNRDMLQYGYWLVNKTLRVSTRGFPVNDNQPPRIVLPGSDTEDKTEAAAIVSSNTTKIFKFPDIVVSYMGTYSCVIFDAGVMRSQVISNESNFIMESAPLFISEPQLTSTVNKVGDEAIIRGCSFSSVFALSNGDAYFLKDGFKKIYDTSGGSINEGFLGSLSYPSTNAADQGFYQCVIFKKGYMQSEIRSKKVHMQFQDVSGTRVEIKLKDQWNDAYYNSTSDKYKNLQSKVERELNKIFENKDPDEKNRRSVQVLGFNPGSINVIARVTYEKVTSKERSRYCNEINTFISKDSFTELSVAGLQLNNLDCCKADKTGDVEYKGAYTYNQALVLQNVTKDCDYNTNSQNNRDCLPNLEIGPQWSEIQLGKCIAKHEITQDLIKLNTTVVCTATMTKNCVPAETVARNLSDVTAKNALVINQDVTFISNTITNILTGLNATDSEKTKEVINDILSTFNSVLSSEQRIVGEAQAKTSSSTSLLKNLEKIAEELTKAITAQPNSTAVVIEKENIAFAIKSSPKKNIEITARSPKSSVNNNVQLDINAENSTDIANDSSVLALIKIPQEAFQLSNEVVHSYYYKNPLLFLTGNDLKRILGENIKEEQFVDSVVLSATLGSGNVENLTTPIVLTFRKNMVIQQDGKSICSFWDFDKTTNIPTVLGGWSSRGCQLSNKTVNADYVQCECNHLTNFALLLDVSQTGNNPLELQIITWIGCAISIFGLVMTILTYLGFRNLIQKLPPKILVSLSISLLCLLIVFLAGAERTSPRLGCQIVAGLLHYFMLTTFFWMFIEALSLYRSFITVFKQGSETKFFVKSAVCAWGLPLIIVAITAGLKHEDYGNDRICTVVDYPFYFAVLLPISAIILANFVVLAIVMVVLSKNAKKRAERLQQNPDRYANIRIAFACNALLGVTWVFAVFAIKDATTVFQWLFCIFNSLQGFFIFIFYTVRSKDVRKEWRRFCGIKSKAPASSSTGAHGYELSTAKKGTYDAKKTGTLVSGGTDYSSLDTDSNGN